MEIERLAFQQKVYCEQLSAQQKEVESLTKSNSSLSERLNANKITITGMVKQNFKFKHHYHLLALQEERKRYLEEKSVLRTIYERLKKEIARSEELEGTVANMSKEANKLTVRKN